MPDASKPLPNARHEAFAQSWAKGVSASEALRQAGYADVPSNAKRLTKNDQVSARRDWLQSQSAAGTVLTIMRKRILLAGIAEDGAKDADRINAIKVDNDLAADGSEAKANEALSAAALATLDSIFGKA